VWSDLHGTQSQYSRILVLTIVRTWIRFEAPGEIGEAWSRRVLLSGYPKSEPLANHLSLFLSLQARRYVSDRLRKRD
jgi:hypothetical protein